MVTHRKALNVNATLARANSHAKKGQVEEAKQLFHSILKTFPQNKQAKKGLKALKQNSSKKKQPAPTQSQINSVLTLYSNNQYKKALESLNILIGDYPNTPLLYNISGVCYRALDQLDLAVKNYKKALAIKPDYAETHYNLGNTLKQLDQLKQAVKHYEKAIAINPDYAKAHGNLGYTFQELGQLNKAVKSYKKALSIQPDYTTAHYNLGITFQELGQLNAAINHYEQALTIKPNYAEAHCNLGVTLNELGQLNAAVNHYEQALTIKPDYAEAHSNFGVTLNELGQLNAAVNHYEQALTIKPDYAEAHYNLGITLKTLGKLNAAVNSYKVALANNPNYTEAHCNLGTTYHDLGQLDEAVKHYEQALTFKPDYPNAWRNLFFSAKALDLSTTQNTWLALYKKNLNEAILNSIHFKILEYRLNAFTPHTVDDCFNDAINALPLKTAEEIQNPSPTHQTKEPQSISNNMIALIHFGRSGTGLLHSLIDNHPEISTFPSIYFSEYYNEEVWGKLIAHGWDRLPENFIKQFAVLFDARSSVPVPGLDKPIANLGKKEGMVNVGVNRDEILTVDQNRFCAELRKLMADSASLTSQTFFTLVHSAYEKALNKSSNEPTIFYHIHNPSPYAKLNFLRYNPESRLLMMVREPVQSCESWIKQEIKKSSENFHNRIVSMLFDIDQIAFRRQEAVGVRLEDLKKHPKETMAALCDWMGINDTPTLYEMTAQGKKWWGDPTSPDYSSKGMSPFDNSAITREVGSIFNEQDQFILRTLFYPFNVRFGYVEENHREFKEDLKTIKPLLDEPFGFQEKLAENLNQDLEIITRSGSALYLRAALHDRWAILNEFNDYPHMLKPLIIQEL